MIKPICLTCGDQLDNEYSDCSCLKNQTEENQMELNESVKNWEAKTNQITEIRDMYGDVLDIKLNEEAFAYLCHEINNPACIILGTARKGKAADITEKDLELIREQIKRISDYVYSLKHKVEKI